MAEQTDGRSYGWTFFSVGRGGGAGRVYYSVNVSAQNTYQDPKIPNKCLKFIWYFLDTNGINGK